MCEYMNVIRLFHFFCEICMPVSTYDWPVNVDPDAALDFTLTTSQWFTMTDLQVQTVSANWGKIVSQVFEILWEK